MAVAKAYCTCATCGKEFEVRRTCYNSRAARSFEQWAPTNYDECEDCMEKRLQAQHEEENAKAMAAAEENGYPELLGTEKQVAWASSIREKALNEVRAFSLDPDMPERFYFRRLMYPAAAHMLLKQRQASWWIDHRESLTDARSIAHLLDRMDEAFVAAVTNLQKEVREGKKPFAQAEEELKAMLGAPAEKKPEAPAEPAPQKPVRPEAVPETRKHDGSADIRADGQTVTALYDKNDAFMSVVKALGFRWKSGWVLEAGERTGTVENIVAELGSRLLNAGFAVRFDSQELLKKAVAGDYAPMCRRWVQSHPAGFFLSWPREDNHYEKAKALPGARYDSPGMAVPERSWAAVVDYASRYGYRITAAAQEKIDRLSGAAQAVAPAPVKKPEYDEKDVLKSSREVLEDLKDD